MSSRNQDEGYDPLREVFQSLNPITQRALVAMGMAPAEWLSEEYRPAYQPQWVYEASLWRGMGYVSFGAGLAPGYVYGMWERGARAGYWPAPEGAEPWTYAGRMAYYESLLEQQDTLSRATQRWEVSQAPWGFQQAWTPVAEAWSAARLATYAFPEAWPLRAFGYGFYGMAQRLGVAATIAPYAKGLTPEQLSWTSAGWAFQYPTWPEWFGASVLEWTGMQVGSWAVMAGLGALLGGAGLRGGLGAAWASLRGGAGISIMQPGLDILLENLGVMGARAIAGQPIFATPEEQQRSITQMTVGAGLIGGGIAYQYLGLGDLSKILGPQAAALTRVGRLGMVGAQTLAYFAGYYPTRWAAEQLGATPEQAVLAGWGAGQLTALGVGTLAARYLPRVAGPELGWMGVSPEYQAALDIMGPPVARTSWITLVGAGIQLAVWGGLGVYEATAGFQKVPTGPEAVSAFYGTSPFGAVGRMFFGALPFHGDIVLQRWQEAAQRGGLVGALSGFMEWSLRNIFGAGVGQEYREYQTWMERHPWVTAEYIEMYTQHMADVSYRRTWAQQGWVPPRAGEEGYAIWGPAGWSQRAYAEEYEAVALAGRPPALYRAEVFGPVQRTWWEEQREEAATLARFGIYQQPLLTPHHIYEYSEELEILIRFGINPAVAGYTPSKRADIEITRERLWSGELHPVAAEKRLRELGVDEDTIKKNMDTYYGIRGLGWSFERYEKDPNLRPTLEAYLAATRELAEIGYDVESGISGYSGLWAGRPGSEPWGPTPPAPTPPPPPYNPPPYDPEAGWIYGQQGLDEIITKPTTIRVAEAGPERVTVTPLQAEWAAKIMLLNRKRRVSRLQVEEISTEQAKMIYIGQKARGV